MCTKEKLNTRNMWLIYRYLYPPFLVKKTLEAFDTWICVFFLKKRQFTIFRSFSLTFNESNVVITFPDFYFQTICFLNILCIMIFIVDALYVKFT
jgi:hypothetical protein